MQTSQITDFEYDLPLELIAQKPLDKKDHSRLFVLDREAKSFSHRHFYDLPDLLVPGDLLVVNDTRVLPSRLIARRHSGGMVKFLLLKPLATDTSIWEAMVTPIKRLKVGEKLTIEKADGTTCDITVHDFNLGPDGFRRVLIHLGARENVYELLNQIGFAPLPPYIQRNYGENTHRADDLLLYQTMFATTPGAVAAPTAGLHFTPEVTAALALKGVETVRITLHVGAGTFKPIEESVESHTIEEETYTVTPDAAEKINKALDEGRRVIAVGTTSMRTLETAGASGRVVPADNAVTALYVKPGFDFKICKAMITNFHLSRSSLLVLVSAFAGRDLLMSAYQTAIAERYRFYSYGDAMLIL